jgi:uncharacterized protein YqkB
MSKQTLRVLAVWSMLCIGWASKIHGFTINLANEDATKLFGSVSGRYTVVDRNAGGGILLPQTTAQLETIAIPVQPLQKYKLQIMAALQDDFVVEKNERAHILTLQSPGYGLSGNYEVLFLNAEGHVVPGLAKTIVRGFFLTQKLHPYTAVFYTPADAVALRVRLRTNRRAMQVTALRLIPETEENTINPNPDFRYGELDYCGWNPDRDGRIYQKPDGEMVFKSGYGARTAAFPLRADKTYLIRGLGDTGSVNLLYLDAEGKQLSNRRVFNLSRAGGELEFTPPEGVVAGRLLVRTAVVSEIRVTEK